MSVIFVSSKDQYSTRWQQAFTQALILEELTVEQAQQASLCFVHLQSTQIDQVLALCVEQKVPVVVMTSLEDVAQARDVISRGAQGYLHYLAVPSQLEQVAQVVMNGGLWLGAALMQAIVKAAPVNQHQPMAQLKKLTLREQSVVNAVVEGKTNKEIARVMDISERTVKAHLSAIFEKLGVRDRLQLALAVSHH